MAKRIQQGDGWRLGIDPTASTYVGLVGSDTWSVELTQEELNDFCRLTLQLNDTMNAVANELMEEERISCEAESEQLWLEAEGFPHHYTLRLMLLKGRRAEGEWNAPATSKLVEAIRLINAF